MSAYEDGFKAASEGKRHDDNPYLGEPNKFGIRPYTDSEAGSQWTLGMRAGLEFKVPKGTRPEEMVSSFRKKSNRYYR